SFANGHLAGPLGWRAEGGYDQLGPDGLFREACHHCDLEIGRFGGGLQATFDEGQHVVPYLYATIGLYHLDLRHSGAEPHDDFGWAFAGGVNFRIGDTWGLAVEARDNGVHEHTFSDSHVDEWYWSPTAMLTWHF